MEGTPENVGMSPFFHWNIPIFLPISMWKLLIALHLLIAIAYAMFAFASTVLCTGDEIGSDTLSENGAHAAAISHYVSDAGWEKAYSPKEKNFFQGMLPLAAVFLPVSLLFFGATEWS